MSRAGFWNLIAATEFPGKETTARGSSRSRSAFDARKNLRLKDRRHYSESWNGFACLRKHDRRKEKHELIPTKHCSKNKQKSAARTWRFISHLAHVWAMS